MIKRLPIFVLTGLLLWPLSFAGAQFDKMSDEAQNLSGLIVDHAIFYDPPSGKIRLELYYQFYNFVLQWLPVGDQYVGKYEVVIRVKDKNDRQVDSYSRQREVAVSTEARTRSRTDFRTNQASFLLDPGKYRVALTLRDRNSSVVLHREIELKLKEIKSRKPTLSDVEFVITAERNSQDSSVFSKGNLTVVPLVTREFSSGDDHNRLLYYLEIYQGSDSDESVFVEATVRRRWGSMVYRDSMTVSLEAPVVRQLREMSLDSLAPGEYELELRLRGRRHKKLDERLTGFSIAWTLDAMLRSDYGSTLNLIGLIAEPNEISKLDKLKTYEERFDGITEFWLRRDPTPGTSTNEVRQEFFRRVRLANRSFTFMRQQGWRTDRGRIYIKHGEPDEIDDYPFAPNSHPYQEWHYYRSGRYRKFTFVDENEDGDYRLVYPYDGLNMRPDF